MESLRRAALSLEDDAAAAQAAIARLRQEIDRHALRAPVSGTVADCACRVNRAWAGTSLPAPVQKRMLDLKRTRHRAANVALAAAFLAAAGAALAQEGKSADSQIYQQRTADGRIVLTDRPLAGAVTQRTWRAAPEDAAAARQRREEARLEALAVNERIQRQIEAQRQRDHELALARMQLADAERARADAAAQPAGVAFVPSFGHRPFPRPTRVPRPGPPRPIQPGFGMFGAPRG